jgi:hypothetical protein
MHHYNQNAQYIMTHCRVIIIGLSINFWAFFFSQKYFISAFYFITMVISYLIFIDLFWMIILSCKKYFMLITWFLYFMYTFLYRGNYFYILYYDKWVCIFHTDRVYYLIWFCLSKTVICVLIIISVFNSSKLSLLKLDVKSLHEFCWAFEKILW